jgi:hypothetical protein
LAETISANAVGHQICGIIRNPKINIDLTSMNAFNACQPDGAPGLVATMGSMYASIWYEVRKKLSDPDKANLDKLLWMLAAQIEGKDDFASVLLKIQSIDTTLTNGRIFTEFNLEHTRRGL